MDNHNEMKKIVQMTREANEQRHEAHSKANLKKHIKTKFKTTMIGSLSRFEELFGELWGHNLPEEELDDDQLYWRDKWQLARTEILNNGNNQSRSAELEIDQHTVRYIKNSYNFQLGTKKGLTEDE